MKRWLMIFSCMTASACAQVQVYDDGTYTVDRYGSKKGALKEQESMRKPTAEEIETIRPTAQLPLNAKVW